MREHAQQRADLVRVRVRVRVGVRVEVRVRVRRGHAEERADLVDP